MISAWWLLLAFISGGCVGFILAAFVSIGDSDDDEDWEDWE